MTSSVPDYYNQIKSCRGKLQPPIYLLYFSCNLLFSQSIKKKHHHSLKQRGSPSFPFRVSCVRWPPFPFVRVSVNLPRDLSCRPTQAARQDPPPRGWVSARIVGPLQPCVSVSRSRASLVCVSLALPLCEQRRHAEQRPRVAGQAARWEACRLRIFHRTPQLVFIQTQFRNSQSD